MEPKDRLEVFSRDGVPFMQLEIRRDHMNVDLWLPEDKLAEARATNLARPHPFDPDNAVVVRFERATDLTKVARWLEDAHQHAVLRKESCEATPTTPPAKSAKKTTTRAKKPSVASAGGPTKTATKKSSAAKRPSTKRSATARRA